MAADNIFIHFGGLKAHKKHYGCKSWGLLAEWGGNFGFRPFGCELQSMQILPPDAAGLDAAQAPHRR